MKRWKAVGMIVVVGGLAGCAPSREKINQYPEPIFATRPVERPRTRYVPPPPAPKPAPRPAPQVAYGWIPAGGVSGRWTDIVIHHSASSSGGAKAFDNFHRNVRKWDGLGYHFVIGNGTDTADGQIEIGPRWVQQKHGAHCKTADNHYNEHGIGICLVGDFNKTSPSPAQMASLAKLLVFLTQKCNIPPGRIHTHGGVTQKTECPGRNFSLYAAKRDLMLSQGTYSRN